MADKAKTVRVTATRNLDLMNQGEVAEIDRDAQVERLLKSGDLVEVDEQGRPKGDVDMGTPATPVPSESAAVTETQAAAEATDTAASRAGRSRTSR